MHYLIKLCFLVTTIFSLNTFSSEKETSHNMMLMVKVPLPIGAQPSIEAIVQGGVLSLQTGVPVLFSPMVENTEKNTPKPNEYDTETGLTMLHKAVMDSNADVNFIKYLVEKAGANTLLKTKEPFQEPGLKASELAKDHDNHQIAEYLEKVEEEQKNKSKSNVKK